MEAVTHAITPLPTDAKSPCIPRILIIHHFNGPSLSLDEGNYHQWAASMRSCLQANHLWGYITGATPRPGADDPRAQANWDENDAAVAGFIANHVCAPELKYADLSSGARAYWRAIEERHEGDDPLRQAMLFIQAMSLPCHPGTNLLVLLDQMQNLLTRAFSLGPVSEDTFHVIVFLFLVSRAGGFNSVREGIWKELKAGEPFGVADLRRRVMLEQFFFGGCHAVPDVSGLVESSVIRQKSSVDALRTVPDLTLEDLTGPTKTVSIPAPSTPPQKISPSSTSSTPTVVSPIQVSPPSRVTVSHPLPPKPQVTTISTQPKFTQSLPLPERPRQQCTNCQRLGHEKRYCISDNGGMAGRSIAESKAQRWLDYRYSQKKKVRVEGLDGTVYMVDPALLTMPASPAASSDAFFSVASSVSSNPLRASNARASVIRSL